MCLSKGWLKVVDGQGHVRAKFAGDKVVGSRGCKWDKLDF